MDYESAYSAGATFSRFIEEARAYRELWLKLAQKAPLDPEASERIRRTGGPWRLLILADDWCGDALNTVPVIARLVDAVDNVQLRIVARDRYPKIRDRHLTNGTRSIPVVILLDEDGVARGWWGPRPTRLQALFEDGLRPLPSKERYRELRRWYAKDGGTSTVREVVELFEHGARAVDPVPVEV